MISERMLSDGSLSFRPDEDFPVTGGFPTGLATGTVKANDDEDTLWEISGVASTSRIAIREALHDPFAGLIIEYVPHEFDNCREDFNRRSLTSLLLHEYEHASDIRSIHCPPLDSKEQNCNEYETQYQADMREVAWWEFLIENHEALGIPEECIDLYKDKLQEQMDQAAKWKAKWESECVN